MRPSPIQWLSNLRFQYKVLLICAPITLAFAALLLVLLHQQQQRIEATRLEMIGAQRIAPLFELMQAVEEHRDNLEFFRQGQAWSRSLKESTSHAEQAFDAMQAGLPEQWHSTRQQLDDIRQRWDALKTQYQDTQDDDTFAHYSNLAARLGELMRFNADDSTMTFDPEVHTHYLISALNYELPALRNELGIIRSRITLMGMTGAMEDAMLGELSARMLLIKQLNHNFLASMGKVPASGKAFPDALTEALAQQPEQLKSLDDLNNDIGSLIGNVSAEGVRKRASELINALDNSRDLALGVLNTHLEARIEQLQLRMAVQGLISALVLIASLLLGLTIYRGIQRGVGTVLTQSQQLACNNLLPSANLPQQDEVGQISQAIEQVRSAQFQAMASIHTLTLKLQSTTDILRQASSQIHQSACAQSDSAATAAQSIDSLSVSVNQVSDHSASAKHLAVETGASAETGQQTVQATRRVMQDIGQATEALVGEMDMLDQRSKDITSIVQTIRDIAEQTNLLALNAAIEAARAGEQGRGFAVVADEVRRLSERTSDSTQSIATLVGGIQQETAQVIDRVRSWSGIISGGLSVVEQAERAMQGIAQHAVSTTTSIAEINAALSEQSSTSHDIARQIECIAQGSQAARQAVGNLNAVAQEVAELTDQLNQLVHTYTVK